VVQRFHPAQGARDTIVGAVGRLQFDVFARRMLDEYDMATGTVKWFNNEKGSASSRSRAAARTSSATSPRSRATATATLNEGDEVEFEVEQGAKGPQAKQVKVTRSAAPPWAAAAARAAATESSTPRPTIHGARPRAAFSRPCTGPATRPSQEPP
jgi:cold shock protein